MNKQLKYFQEDMAFKLDAIIVILVFGMEFSWWVRAAIAGMCIGQFFYVLRAAWMWNKSQTETDGEIVECLFDIAQRFSTVFPLTDEDRQALNQAADLIKKAREGQGK
ncbi:MAG: hypothetical protein WCV67_02985 [Victivallaceae bacterium]|jgi:hypothetical protein